MKRSIDHNCEPQAMGLYLMALRARMAEIRSLRRRLLFEQGKRTVRGGMPTAVFRGRVDSAVATFARQELASAGRE